MRRLRAPLAIAAAVLVATSALGGTARATGPTDLRRIAGPDRFATAASLAVDRFTSASDAVVARSDDPADALAGSYVAGSHIGPVLLAEQHAVPPATIDALQTRHVHKVRVLGGTGALGPEVVAQLEAAGFVVERVAGADRYATAAAVAANSGVANVGVRGGQGATVLLANGDRPADALSVGPLAFGQQWPVLLTTAAALPAPTRQSLDDLGIRHVIVVGGTAAVSDAVVADLERSGRTVERVGGADRESTATAVADFLVALGEPLTRVEVAAASSFADALALGPHAAPAAPVLLCHAVDDCGATTLAWIELHSDRVDTVVIAGGTAVISTVAETQLRAAAGA
jgi:putative cell wall-binding protein